MSSGYQGRIKRGKKAMLGITFRSGYGSCQNASTFMLYLGALDTFYFLQNIGEKSTSSVKISSLPSIMVKHSMILALSLMPE